MPPGHERNWEQSAIAETRVRGCLDHAQKLLNFTIDKCRRFAFGPRKSLSLDFPGRIHDEHSFSVSQENSIRIAAMCCLTVGARGPVLNDFDMLRP
jgi:hypothetical protein